MKNIPFFTFEHMHPPLREEMTKAFQACYDSGWLVLGEGIKRFEKSYAEYSGTAHAITVADGLDALVLALQALGIGEGDEIIAPSNTYIATWLAATQLGAKIVPVEPDERTFNIDVTRIEAAVTSKTRAIMPVNLYGQPCLLSEIMEIADRLNIYVIEDNAQSQGATYDGKKTGSFGHANGVSFYPGKNLGALGEAGAVTTNDEETAKKLFALRNYGSHKKYHNLYLGRNGRMDELQAYFLEIKLKHLDAWNSERQKISQWYYEGLADVSDILLPVIAPKCNSVFHQFIILTDRRETLQNHLKEKGIVTLIHYPIPPHLQPAYAHLPFKKGDFPIAERLADEMLSLPIYPGLTQNEVQRVCQAIGDFF